MQDESHAIGEIGAIVVLFRSFNSTVNIIALFNCYFISLTFVIFCCLKMITECITI